MNGIRLSKYTNLILILASFRTEINSLELNCNIVTTEKHRNETQINVTPIAGVKKCAKDYRDIVIIKKCEQFIDSSHLISDLLIFTPVTNRFKNITYWNKYCATCNHETELEYWPPWKPGDMKLKCMLFELDIILGSAASVYHRITQNSNSNGLKLITNAVNSTELQCSLDENWPLNLLYYAIPCLVNVFRFSQKTTLKTCQYIKNNGRICLHMNMIIEGIDFVFNEYNEIHLFDESVNPEFIQSGYTIQSGLNNVIYLCEKNDIMYETFDWVEIVVMIFSIIFIGIYLFLNFTKRYLQNFPSKIIYSYAIGLLVMYSLLTFVYLLFPLSCVRYILAQFSWFFHFFWTMIMSLEFCRLTYSTVKKRKVTVSSQPKRYLIYCIVGYVIPAILPVIYFLILETDGNRCPQIPEHLGVPCKPAENTAAWYFMRILEIIFNGSFFIVIPILFAVQAGVLIYVIKCGPTRIRSTANRSHLLILMKMAYIMGAHWMLYIFCSYYGYNRNSIVITAASIFSQLSIDFQGVFVFFAFGFKKRWINEVLYKVGWKESIQQSFSAGTVQVNLSSGQSTDSTGMEKSAQQSISAGRGSTAQLFSSTKSTDSTEVKV